MEEHFFRLVEPVVIHEGPADAQVDTAASVVARLGAMTRLRSAFSPYLNQQSNPLFVHPDLCTEVVVQHSHVHEYKKLQGKIYMMTVREVYHTNFIYKMDYTAINVTSLKLANLLGKI